MTIKSTATTLPQSRTAEDLRKLPAPERDALLSLAAVHAEADYRQDPHLTDFEAFGEEDLHGHSSNSHSR